MADSNTNQRVTNAILQKDIENLAVQVEQWQAETRRARDKDSGRLKVVETHVIRCATLWDKHEKTHQTIDKDIGAVEGDIKKWSSAGGFVGAIAAIITSQFLDR